MGTPVLNVAVAKWAERLPGLRRVPLAKLVIAAELGMLVKAHYERLSLTERRRLLVLLRETRGRPSNLTPRQRKEFEALIGKLEPKLFARNAVERFAPVPAAKKS